MYTLPANTSVESFPFSSGGAHWARRVQRAGKVVPWIIKNFKLVPICIKIIYSGNRHHYFSKSFDEPQNCQWPGTHVRYVRSHQREDCGGKYSQSHRVLSTEPLG